MNKTVPVKEGLFEFEPGNMEQIQLIGSECLNCHEKHFPQRVICPNCSAQKLKKIGLESSGKLATYTIVRQAPPNWQGRVPYVIAAVMLDDGVEVTSHLIGCKDEDIKIGARVEVVAGRLRNTEAGEEMIAPMFRMISF